MDYDGSSISEIFRGTTSKGTDTSISEYASNNMDQGRLGLSISGASAYTGTIYRAYFYTRELTDTERAAIVNDGWTPTKD
jgi:hypothetical protein